MPLKIEALQPDILHALRGRGHSDEEITRMDAEKAFEEWCGWKFGYTEWATTFRRVQQNLLQATEGDVK